ncbi:hypothetical protein P7K49_014244 [Saguinus oedipus]|uniref:Grh/CP2 DB domain-containing protein n=1 Tax=Saguinus oedipus TaxID=9490 RepID=A0ABQ9VI76_SAGOE|nr:hypothetical protein P7K49_014244 [Saguinus oedipus]
MEKAHVATIPDPGEAVRSGPNASLNGFTLQVAAPSVQAWKLLSTGQEVSAVWRELRFPAEPGKGYGQSYEIRLLENRKLGDFQDLNTKYVKSIIRVVFHDRRLQYTEHQQLEGWRWSRPGDRILDIDIPLSVGILDPRASPTQLNAIEFLWDPAKRASAFIQVHCISTEFTPRKHGGEKGVPFRVQIDTFKQNENGEYTEHLHSASCQIKVFKRPSKEHSIPLARGFYLDSDRLSLFFISSIWTTEDSSQQYSSVSCVASGRCGGLHELASLSGHEGSPCSSRPQLPSPQPL